MRVCLGPADDPAVGGRVQSVVQFGLGVAGKTVGEEGLAKNVDDFCFGWW